MFGFVSRRAPLNVPLLFRDNRGISSLRLSRCFANFICSSGFREIPLLVSGEQHQGREYEQLKNNIDLRVFLVFPVFNGSEFFFFVNHFF